MATSVLKLLFPTHLQKSSTVHYLQAWPRCCEAKNDIDVFVWPAAVAACGVFALLHQQEGQLDIGLFTMEFDEGVEHDTIYKSLSNYEQ